MTAPSTRRRLRDALADGNMIVAPGVFDGLSAALVGRVGFAAGYMTGAGVAASGYGVPDIGLTTQTEMTERARVLAGVLGEVPLIADADTGYGSPLNVIRTVREYEAAGVAAIQLEDQGFPKKCGHLPDKDVITAQEFVAKLDAALEARTDPDLVVIARTDARAPLGLDAAIDRANAYAAAGADVVFVEAPRDVDEIERIAKEVAAPKLINLVQGGLTPIESTQRLRDLGFAIAIHPSLPLAAAAGAMANALGALTGRDTTDLLPASPADFFDVVGLAEWTELGQRYATEGR